MLRLSALDKNYALTTGRGLLGGAHALQIGYYFSRRQAGNGRNELPVVGPANGRGGVCSGYGTQWDVFMDMMEPLVTQLPYMTLIGNHERDWPDTGDRYLNGVRDSGTSLTPWGTLRTHPRFASPLPTLNSLHASCAQCLVPTAIKLKIQAPRLEFLQGVAPSPLPLSPGMLRTSFRSFCPGPAMFWSRPRLLPGCSHTLRK